MITKMNNNEENMIGEFMRLNKGKGKVELDMEIWFVIRNLLLIIMIIISSPKVKEYHCNSKNVNCNS